MSKSYEMAVYECLRVKDYGPEGEALVGQEDASQLCKEADRQLAAAEQMAEALRHASVILCKSAPGKRYVEIIFPELEDAQAFHRIVIDAWEATKK